MSKIMRPKTAGASLEAFIKKVADVKEVDYLNEDTMVSITPTSTGVGLAIANTGTVSVTEDDTNSDYLDSKIVEGTCIKTTVLDPASVESLEIGLEIDNGVAFPGVPEDWQLFYRTDEDLLYIYVPGSGGGWTAIGAGGAVVDAGTAAGQMLYWDAVNNKWVASDIEYLGYNSAIKQFMVGNSANPGVLRSTYVHQYFAAGALSTGNIGTLDSGALTSAMYVTGAPIAGLHSDRAADTALTQLIASASSTLIVNNLANRYNWLFLQELPGSPPGSIVYNAAGSELFQEADYVCLLGTPYAKTYDRNWAGATRNRYCGTGTITQNPPPVPDTLGVTFFYALPDANYAVVFTGRRKSGIPTVHTVFPLIPLVSIDVSCFVVAKGASGFTGQARYAVTDSNTNLGAASVLGPGMDLYDNYTVLVGACGILPPNNTLAAAGLDTHEWILRRHF